MLCGSIRVVLLYQQCCIPWVRGRLHLVAAGPGELPGATPQESRSASDRAGRSPPSEHQTVPCASARRGTSLAPRSPLISAESAISKTADSALLQGKSRYWTCDVLS